MAERNYYVLCDDNCKFPAMSKEQILTAIEQAITTGEIKDVDTGFVTKIKETNANKALSFWIGTQAEYNALTERAENCFYIITDEPDINETLNDFNDKLSALDDSLNKSVKELSDDIEVLNGDVSGRLWHKTLFIPDSITTPSVNDIRHVWDQLPESIAFSATLKNKTYESAVFGYRVGEYGYFIYLTHYSSYLQAGRYIKGDIYMESTRYIWKEIENLKAKNASANVSLVGNVSETVGEGYFPVFTDEIIGNYSLLAFEVSDYNTGNGAVLMAYGRERDLGNGLERIFYTTMGGWSFTGRYHIANGEFTVYDCSLDGDQVQLNEIIGILPLKTYLGG